MSSNILPVLKNAPVPGTMWSSDSCSRILNINIRYKWQFRFKRLLLNPERLPSSGDWVGFIASLHARNKELVPDVNFPVREKSRLLRRTSCTPLLSKINKFHSLEPHFQSILIHSLLSSFLPFCLCYSRLEIKLFMKSPPTLCRLQNSSILSSSILLPSKYLVKDPNGRDLFYVGCPNSLTNKCNKIFNLSVQCNLQCNLVDWETGQSCAQYKDMKR